MSFFFFNQKKSISEETSNNYQDGPVSRIRGVPLFQEDKYLESDLIFKCVNGEKVINQTSVNDDYCDCEDGSDEPGTSACSDIHVVFYCINKGYKTMKLSTSRVDDGICDCCDGSDEGKIKRCPSICEKVAAKERETLEKTRITYQSGRQILHGIEKQVRSNLESKVANYDAYKKDLEIWTTKLSNFKSQNENQRKQLEEHYQNVQTAAIEEVSSLLSIHSLSTTELTKFLSSLFNVLKLSEMDVMNILNGNYHLIDSSSHSSPPHDHSHDSGMDHDSYQEDDGYNDDRHQHHEEHDYDQESSISSSSEGLEYDTSSPTTTTNQGDDDSDIQSCELYILSKDLRMRSLCKSEDILQSTSKLLSEHILRAKKPFQELQILLGYYQLHETFEGSDEFFNQVLSSSTAEANDVCPAQFQTLDISTCQIHEKLESLHELLDKSIDTIDSNSPMPLEKYYLETKTLVTESEQKVQEAESLLQEAQIAKADMEHPYMAIIGFKGEKFSVHDGRYIYSVYVLDRVTQAEGEGMHEVSLGKYKTVEDLENGNQIWKYEDGDYCWNFGARKAHVQVTCGMENKVLSAREPSTCFYLLEMESPLACTKKFAEANGLE